MSNLNKSDQKSAQEIWYIFAIVARSDKEKMMKRNKQKGNEEKTRKAIN